MRAFEIITTEGLMSPKSLRRAAANIDARAGMEFEMYVPDAGAKIEGDPEEDYSQDVDVSSFEEIIDFFSGTDQQPGRYNDRGDIIRFRRALDSDYADWLAEKQSKFFTTNKEEIVMQYLIEFENLSGGELAEVLATALEYTYNDRYYKKAEQSFYRDPEDYDFYSNNDDWAQETFSTMRNVEQEYNINWPYWYTPEFESTYSIDDVASDFKEMIGREVYTSDRYHGGSRAPGAYDIEPDSSLDQPDNREDGGLEFVSPVLSVNDMISDLNKVVNWARQNRCYTNSSCGLHMNVSLPQFETDGLDQLDYVKLVLFCGDNYVLEQFGRELGGINDANTFAASALGKISTALTSRPGIVNQMLANMRGQMNEIASRVIYGQATSKYTSIHKHGDYIEFRAPGGDWLGEDLSKLEDTLLRFVVALDIAADKNKYRDEYAKKLYKLMMSDIKIKHYDPTDPANAKNPTKFSDKAGPGSKQLVTSTNTYKDVLSIFADYSSGQLSMAALKAFIKQYQTQRPTVGYKTLPNNQPSTPAGQISSLSGSQTADGGARWFTIANPQGFEREIQANSTSEAIQMARERYPDDFSEGATVYAWSTS
jgi:hypothetical protein